MRKNPIIQQNILCALLFQAYFSGLVDFKSYELEAIRKMGNYSGTLPFYLKGVLLKLVNRIGE